MIATIEVKSTLTKEGLGNAAKAAYRAKRLEPNAVASFRTGYIPPAILNYVVAYDGPSNMKTVYGWIGATYRENGIPETELPLETEKRLSTPSEALDAVFVLGRGFLYMDNLPLGFVSQDVRQANPSLKWVFGDTSDGNLLLLFLMLQGATANVEAKWLNPLPYLSGAAVGNIDWGK